MNFLTDLFNNIDEMKKQKKAKKSAPKMETKVKLLDFEKMISDAARSRGVQPRTYLTALASANPKFGESKLVQALLGEYSLGQVGMGARDKYKDRDSKIGVTTSPKPKGAKEPHFKKDKKKMKEATTASRQDLESSLNHLYNILNTVANDDKSNVLKSEEEELMAGELIGHVAEFKASIEGDVGSRSESVKEAKTVGGALAQGHLETMTNQRFKEFYGMTKDEYIKKHGDPKKEGIFEGPDKARAIRIDKMMRANRMQELADLLADAMHFAEITGLDFGRELERAKDYYDEADQMETVSDCACEGEADCDCDNVEEALKFQGKYKEGDKIKAYDFKPGVPGRPDRFIVGTVIKVDAESVSQPGALGYHVKVETDMPREKESAGAGNRKGKTIFVPYEMGMDYDERISPA